MNVFVLIKVVRFEPAGLVSQSFVDIGKVFSVDVFVGAVVIVGCVLAAILKSGYCVIEKLLYYN
jgi:hypothetical protein